MSSVTDTVTYEQDVELVWHAAINCVAMKGYTVYDRVDATRQLMCRTPSASLKRSAGQVIKITVTPLGPQKAQLDILVTSIDERKERPIWARFLRRPREELIDEMIGSISRLLPVLEPSTPPSAPQRESGMPGQHAPEAASMAQEIASSCASCGARVADPSMRFCGFCGKPLASGQGASGTDTALEA
jgi:hypothetical protein